MAVCEVSLMHEMAVQVSMRSRGIERAFLAGPATDGTLLGSEWRFDGKNQRVPSFRIVGPWDGKGTD